MARASAQQLRQVRDELFGNAVAAIDRSDWVGAKRLLEGLLLSNPDDFEGRYWFARCLGALGQPETGASMLRALMREGNKVSWLRFSLAEMLLTNSDPKGALAEYKLLEAVGTTDDKEMYRLACWIILLRQLSLFSRGASFCLPQTHLRLVCAHTLSQAIARDLNH
jgi:predicted Zn-dependent protease